MKSKQFAFVPAIAGLPPLTGCLTPSDDQSVDVQGQARGTVWAESTTQARPDRFHLNLVPTHDIPGTLARCRRARGHATEAFDRVRLPGTIAVMTRAGTEPAVFTRDGGFGRARDRERILGGLWRPRQQMDYRGRGRAKVDLWAFGVVASGRRGLARTPLTFAFRRSAVIPFPRLAPTTNISENEVDTARLRTIRTQGLRAPVVRAQHPDHVGRMVAGRRGLRMGARCSGRPQNPWVCGAKNDEKRLATTGLVRPPA
jgi:hypothetical protein